MTDKSQYNIGPGGSISREDPSEDPVFIPPNPQTPLPIRPNALATQVMVIHHRPDGTDQILLPGDGFTIDEEGKLRVLPDEVGPRTGGITCIAVEAIQGKPWFIYSSEELPDDGET